MALSNERNTYTKLHSHDIYKMHPAEGHLVTISVKLFFNLNFDIKEADV